MTSQNKDTPNYEPSEDVKEHIEKIYSRQDEMYTFMKESGIFDEIETMKKEYNNYQKSFKPGELPPVKLAEAIALVEAKSSAEVKIMPEAVIRPRNQKDETKILALTKLLEDIDNTNQSSLVNIKKIYEKNIVGFAYKKVYWRETYRTIKKILDKTDENGDIQWKEHTVKGESGVCEKLIPQDQLLIDENATCLEDAGEVIEVWQGDYEKAKLEFGNFNNFKYVRAGYLSNAVNETIAQRQRKTTGSFSDIVEVIAYLYYNKYKDEYSIVMNGVLLTPLGNPLPYEFYKHEKEFFPYTRSICRYMPQERELFPKGDVAIISRLAMIKSILMNCLVSQVVTNAKSPLVVSKDTEKRLIKDQLSWQSHDIIGVSNKEASEIMKVLQVSPDVNGVNTGIKIIDELMTIYTGVDVRSLLSSVRETATKTATRRELSAERTSAGIKFSENDDLYREKKIKLALIKQYYGEEEKYLDDDTLMNDKPKVIRTKKKVSVKDKNFKWVKKINPITPEDVQKLQDETSIDENILNAIFHKGKKKLEFADDIENLRKRLPAIGIKAKDMEAIEALFEANTEVLLEDEDKEGYYGEIEVTEELLRTPYEVLVLPKGDLPYSEAAEMEKMERMLPLLMQLPVNQENLAKHAVKVNNMPEDLTEKAPQPQGAPQGMPQGTPSPQPQTQNMLV